MPNIGRKFRQLLDASGVVSDEDLLARFVADRDDPSFEVLVRRHGPMVMAVCSRVLRHRQDAEDAFQATFLVLARRAGSVGERSLVGSWLYGVAYRTALRARRLAYARRARETRAAEARPTEHSPINSGPSPEELAALDRELSGLPSVYRAAVVACDLEGLSRREAATQLGWSEGTLSSRLARGRSLLARRLTRQGLAVPALGLVAMYGPVAVAAELVVATVRMGKLVAAGKAVIAAPVAALMEETMKTMLITKFKGLVALVAVGGSVAVTAAAGWQGSADTTGDTPKPVEPLTRTEVKSDRDRVAELERERDRLLKQVAELQARLERAELLATEATQKNKLQSELLNRATELERERDRLLTLMAELQARLVRAELLATEVTQKNKLQSELLNRATNSPGQPSRPASEKPFVQTYSISEWVKSDKEGEALAKVVRATIEPASWGPDTGVEFLPGLNLLVVRQTKVCHVQVEEFLMNLMKLKERQAQEKK